MHEKGVRGILPWHPLPPAPPIPPARTGAHLPRRRVPQLARPAVEQAYEDVQYRHVGQLRPHLAGNRQRPLRERPGACEGWSACQSVDRPLVRPVPRFVLGPGWRSSPNPRPRWVERHEGRKGRGKGEGGRGGGVGCDVEPVTVGAQLFQRATDSDPSASDRVPARVSWPVSQSVGRWLGLCRASC
jgi:hypothetical protein